MIVAAVICAVQLTYHRKENGDEVTGHGTAFYADVAKYGYLGQCYLLTAAHNVPEKSYDLHVNDNAAEVVAIDRELDIALLKSKPADDTLHFAEKDSGKGDIVRMQAAPRGEAVQTFAGVVEKRFDGGFLRTRCAMEFDHGCSGGPLLNASGEVVGMAVAGIPFKGDLEHKHGLFLPLCAIESFLGEHRR